MALSILGEIGLRSATPHCREAMLAAGCEVTDDGRLLIPLGLVERCLGTAGRDFTLRDLYDMARLADQLANITHVPAHRCRPRI